MRLEDSLFFPQKYVQRQILLNSSALLARGAMATLASPAEIVERDAIDWDPLECRNRF